MAPLRAGPPVENPRGRHVSAPAASCDDAACYLARQDWGAPVRVTDAADGVLDLVLRG